jgi:aspartate aminotransferase
MFALTKAYAMDGWRIGYVTCSRRFMPAILQITANNVTHVNVFIQHGAHAAISGPQESFEAMLAEDDRRRRLVCNRLNAIDGMLCPRPQGTIYAFPDVRAFNKSSAQLADELLFETGVVVEDGGFYGAAGEGHLRVCFGSEPYELLEEAMNRIEVFFARQMLRRAS